MPYLYFFSTDILKGQPVKQHCISSAAGSVRPAQANSYLQNSFSVSCLHNTCESPA